MSRARIARRIAAATAYGGGGITMLGALTYGLILIETKLAQRIINAVPGGEPPVADGRYGPRLGRPISFAMIGDSTAAGLGVRRADETPGALLAAGLSAIADRPVQLTNVAKSGSRSAALSDQIDQVLAAHADRPGLDIAIIMVGANDVTGRIRPAESVRYLDTAVRRLRAAGCHVVVGTCPDLGTVEPVAWPLRWLARRASRQLAAAQTIVTVEAGARTVSLADLLADEFRAAPREMFSADRYHPSARGYAAAAYALLPSMAAVLGLEPEPEALPGPRSGVGVLPIYLAAAEAAEEPGTEVAATRVAGRERGPRGRWALLLRRGVASGSAATTAQAMPDGA